MRIEGLPAGAGATLPELVDDPDEPTWRWRFLDHPRAPRRPYAAMLHHDAAFVGIRAAMPASLVVGGRLRSGAQLVQGPKDRRALSDERRLALGHGLLAELEEAGVELAYAVPGGPWSAEDLGQLGFRRAFDFVQRNVSIGLGEVSHTLEDVALSPVRRLAKFARRMRMKLIEVEFDGQWSSYAARLFASRRDELGFGLDRDESYLMWRYGQHPERQYRLLVLRRQAGVGIDAYAVVRLHKDPERARTFVQLVDHFTKLGERRSTAWLLGELVLWGLAEQADELETFAPAESTLENVFLSLGALRKRSERPWMIKALANATPLVVSPDNAQVRAGDLDVF